LHNLSHSQLDALVGKLASFDVFSRPLKILVVTHDS
jgi:hypothetical protein